jgi:hypothetical protein
MVLFDMLIHFTLIFIFVAWPAIFTLRNIWISTESSDILNRWITLLFHNSDDPSGSFVAAHGFWPWNIFLAHMQLSHSAIAWDVICAMNMLKA